MLELWGKRSTPSLPSPSGSLWPKNGWGFTSQSDLLLVPFTNLNKIFPVGWGCRIHRLLLCNECPVYDTQRSNSEVLVMLELWGIRSTHSLLSLPGPLWLGVVVPDRVLSMGLTELNCVLMLNWTAWNRAVLAFKLRTYAKLNCLK